ncbi:DUF2971 domain-containing protein [Pseudocolwellia sp. HL-MZ19]|uniref:DUF2971 domain-containing protein n=1 Tax=unclassified Pseudocolwellia TaxID=2848178 RepID=UPI003CECF88F
MILKPEITSLYHYQTLTLNTSIQKEIDSRAIRLTDNIILDNYKIDPIKERTVFYSSPCDFNDLYEGGYKFIISDDSDNKASQLFFELIDMGKQLGLMNNEILEKLNTPFITADTFKPRWPQFASGLMVMMKNIIGVYCLTPSAKNATMWAHYADNNQGVVLEFERNETNICGLESFEINYSQTHPTIDLCTSLNEMLIIGRAEADFDRMNKLKSSEFRRFIYSKSTDWKYEDEWRTVHGSSGLHKMPGKLKSIIFGYNTPPEVIEYIKQHIKDVEFKYIKFDKEKYELNVCTEKEYEWHKYLNNIQSINVPDVEKVKSLMTNPARL